MAEKYPYPPSNGREFLSFVDKKAGRAFNINKWKVENGTLIKWMADPQYVSEDSIRQNPIEKFEDCLTWCVEHGHEQEARSIASRIAKLVECTLIPHEDIETNSATDIRDALLDNSEKMGAFHSAIRAMERTDLVRFLGETVIGQIQKAILMFEAERWEQWRTEKDDTYPNGSRPRI
jgi:hypothetical protein